MPCGPLDQISQQLIAEGCCTPVTFIEAGDSPSADLPRITVDDEEHEKPVDELFHLAMELFVSPDTWRIERFRKAVGWSDDHLAQEIKVLRDEREQLQQRYKASRSRLQQHLRPDQWNHDHFTAWLISEFKYPWMQSELPSGIRIVQQTPDPIQTNTDKTIRSAVHAIRDALKTFQTYQLARALKKCAEPNMIDYVAAHNEILRTEDVVHVFWPMLVAKGTAAKLKIMKFCDICKHHVLPNFQEFVRKALNIHPSSLTLCATGPVTVRHNVRLDLGLGVGNSEEPAQCGVCDQPIGRKPATDGILYLMGGGEPNQHTCSIDQCGQQVHVECRQRHEATKHGTLEQP